MQRKMRLSPTGEGAPLVGPSGAPTGDEPYHSSAPRESLWYHSAFIMMAEVMGMGLLGLPHAMANLGWILGLSAAILFGLAAAYAALLLSRLKNELYTHTESYADLAVLTCGPSFGAFTRIGVLLTWAAILPFFLLSCAESLETLFGPRLLLHSYQWTLLVAFLLIGPLQLRTLHQVSWLSFASSCAVILAVAVIVLALLFGDADPEEGRQLSPSNGNGGRTNHSHSLWLPPNSILIDSFRHISSFVFAYQGHSVFLEIMREMKEPRTFTKSIYSAYTLMILVYLCTSALGYLAFGRDVAGFLPDSMQNGTAKSLVGLLLTLHTGVAYMVTAQPLHRAIHGFFFPQTVLEPSSIQQPRAAIHWLCISTAQMTISILLATAVPFFAELQSLLGALTGAPMIFGAPALFYVRGRWLHGLPIKTVDIILCGVFLCVLTPLFTIAGTATSVYGIVQEWAAVQP